MKHSNIYSCTYRSCNILQWWSQMLHYKHTVVSGGSFHLLPATGNAMASLVRNSSEEAPWLQILLLSDIPATFKLVEIPPGHSAVQVDHPREKREKLSHHSTFPSRRGISVTTWYNNCCMAGPQVQYHHFIPCPFCMDKASFDISRQIIVFPSPLSDQEGC